MLQSTVEDHTSQQLYGVSSSVCAVYIYIHTYVNVLKPPHKLISH